MRIKQRLYTRLGPAIAARRDSRVARLAARGAHAYLNFYCGFSYDADRNGEARVLRIVSDGAQTIFDVGANVGDWSRRALDVSSGATVHAFEIVPRTADELARRLSGVGDRLVVNHHGLSDIDGSAAVKVYPGFAEGSGFTDYGHGEDFEWQELPVRRGDTYVQDTGLERIDFLKIDAEGADLAVIRGFGALLGDARIDVIQFEYGFANVLSRALLSDFYAELRPNGYLVGKVYPHRVDFQNYDVRMEDFLGPNYVAVRQQREDLITALARPS
jgi:FkbM family methyltransferase